MSKKRYVVELSADERKRLEDLIRKGKSSAKKQLKARITGLLSGSPPTDTRPQARAKMGNLNVRSD